MHYGLTVGSESWSLAAPFAISRGTKTHANVVVVELTDGLHVGRGESVPYARYDETTESVIAQIRSVGANLTAELTHGQLKQVLPAGAARNAIDCALWDLEARRRKSSVDALLELPRPDVLQTAVTVGIDTPEAMAAMAQSYGPVPLIKVKVDGKSPDRQIMAVHQAAPAARLIVDANESWDLSILRELQPLLATHAVVLIEQPLPADDDAALEGFTSCVPLCADEACHTITDLPRVLSRYQAVNIKLDKTGGLTSALELLAAARAEGMTVMVGCMVCTSLAIAPAWLVAATADFVDLDGPVLLREDRRGGAHFEAGRLTAPQRTLWGG